MKKTMKYIEINGAFHVWEIKGFYDTKKYYCLVSEKKPITIPDAQCHYIGYFGKNPQNMPIIKGNKLLARGIKL